MSFTKESVLDHFKSNETALTYDTTTGGVTKVLANDVLSLYLESNSLDGKVVLDNACGTGVVTKGLIARTGDITIEAADISEAMVGYLSDTMNDKGAKVTANVMDAQVVPSDILADSGTYIRG